MMDLREALSVAVDALRGNKLRAILTSDEMKKRLIADGSDPAPSTPEEYGDNIKREEGKWAALVQKLGLKLE